MAITNTQSLYQYTLGSLNQALAYPVYFLDSSDITVATTDPTTKVDTTLVLNNDYSVTGAGNQDGGTVTMAPGIVGNIVTIYLTPNLTQPTSFVENGAFSESTIEQTVDRLCMEIHELNNQLQRTFRIPNSNAVTTPFPFTTRLDGIPYFDSVTGALGLVTRQSIILAAQTGVPTEAANTILGNDTGSPSSPLSLTPLRVRKLAFVNASGLVGGDYIDKTTNLITTTGQLDTVQAIQTNSFVQFGQVTLGSSSTTATNLVLSNSSGLKTWHARLKGSAVNVDSFELYNATDNITALRLLASGDVLLPGNVGIGGTAISKLHVFGAANGLTNQIRLAANKTGWGDITGQLQTTAGGSISADGLRVSVDSGYIDLIPGGGTGLRIDHGGNVGIGASPASSRLRISGLPTSSSGLTSGEVWNNSGVLTIV